jgi:hypothetical protein
MTRANYDVKPDEGDNNDDYYALKEMLFLHHKKWLPGIG